MRSSPCSPVEYELFNLQNQVSQLSYTVLEQGREVYRTTLQTSNDGLRGLVTDFS